VRETPLAGRRECYQPGVTAPAGRS